MRSVWSSSIWRRHQAGIILCIFLALMSPLVNRAQDSTEIFSEQQLVWFVKNYHPITKQAALLLDQGESTVRRARGSFDPYLYTNLDQKQFDDKEYFNLLGSGLKIPTWYGVEIQSGFKQNSGVFLNPENNLPSAGLWNLGISVPLGQGLWIDQRRTTLRQAALFAQSTRAEQQKRVNDLLFDAIKQYWKWVEAWNQFVVYEESVILAEDRFNAVKQSYFLGDVPGIDTLEAFIQVQNRQMKRNEFSLLYQNETLALSNYLWFENNTPLVITDGLQPPKIEASEIVDPVPEDTLNQLLERLVNMHPDMLLYDLKLGSLELERRLKAEGLKPTVNVNYNILNEALVPDRGNEYSPENYEFGLAFNFPIFLRKQRGELELSKIKIQDTQFGRQQKLLKLENRLNQYYNEQENLLAQVDLFSNAVNNYDRLLEGERIKFDAGESSLFLVNSRETNLIAARLRLIKLASQYHQVFNGIWWSAGQLYGKR